MWLQRILFIQGLYYLLTAVWPVIHMKSFERITGHKADHWLVYTISLLLICSSFVYIFSTIARNKFIPLETIILSLTNCTVLIGIDVFFVFKKVISKIYLLDAICEMMILLGVLFSWR